MAAKMIAIEPYTGDTSFSNWVERLEVYFRVNKIDVEEKKDQLIYLCGQATFDQLKMLYPGVDLNTLTYDAFVDKLKKRYDKKETKSMQRYFFMSRNQGPNESIEDFILGVKMLANECNYGAFKEEAIIDRYKMGVYNIELKKKTIG